MAVATAGDLVSVRAAQAREARGARAVGLFIDLVVSSVLYAVINDVFGVPGYGAPLAVLILVWLVYVTVPEAVYGATLGKMLSGVCVVRVDGHPLSLGSVIVRNLGRFIDALPFLYLLGGLAVVMTGRSQRFGDLFAGTTVVGRRYATDPGDTRRPRRGDGRKLAYGLLAAFIFTVVFNYFGRPPLIVEGAYRDRSLQLDSYSLGQAQWSAGQVTYVLTGTKGNARCTGSIELFWTLGGWELSGWTESCP